MVTGSSNSVVAQHDWTTRLAVWLKYHGWVNVRCLCGATHRWFWMPSSLWRWADGYVDNKRETLKQGEKLDEQQHSQCG